MTTENQVTSEMEPTSDYADLQAEASRLLEFKKQHIRKQNQTPCPACATLVHINANKCPHCSSDVAAHTALAREELRKLNDITRELYELQKKHMELNEEETSRRPFWERIVAFVSDPQFRDDLKIVLPSLFLFFVLLVSLRIVGNPLLFWSVSIVGGFFAYTLLKRSAYRKHITVDLYRTALIFGLVMVLSSGITGSMLAFPGRSTTSVEVQRPTVNVRESATTGSSVVATVNRGDKLKVLSQEGSWYKIKTSDGKTGWVYAELVK